MSDSAGSVVLVYTLYGDRHAAETAAAHVIEQGLAACVNLLAPVTSFYTWEGVVERQEEYPALMKTSVAGRDALMAWIAAHHAYAVPAILSWPAEAAPSFARWVGENAKVS